MSTRLINDINGLVRQVPIINVSGSQPDRRFDSLISVLELVMLFEATTQAFQNANGVINGRLTLKCSTCCCRSWTTAS